MNLSHLLIEAIQADRESEIATRPAASQLTSAQKNARLVARQARMRHRLALAI